MVVGLHPQLATVLDEILATGTYQMPSNFTGTGAPGNFLEYLFGIDGGNADIPDMASWELKFHGGNSLLTLFHKDPFPREELRQFVYDNGWKTDKGETSFRHTIHGNKETSRGFYVTNSENRITVANTDPSINQLYWDHDTIINAFVQKLRRLIFVVGQRKQQFVTYEKAYLLQELQVQRFLNAITEGVIAVDFDAKIRANGTFRNHGTKFRIKPEHLPLIYQDVKMFGKKG